MKKLLPLLILAILAFGFINSDESLKDKELESLRLELANLKNPKSATSVKRLAALPPYSMTKQSISYPTFAVVFVALRSL